MRTLTQFMALSKDDTVVLSFAFDDGATVEIPQSDDTALDAMAVEILPVEPPTMPAASVSWWEWFTAASEDEEEEAEEEADAPVVDLGPVTTEPAQVNIFAAKPDKIVIDAEAPTSEPDPPIPSYDNVGSREERRRALEAMAIAPMRKLAGGPEYRIKGASKIRGGKLALIEVILDADAQAGRFAKAPEAPEPTPLTAKAIAAAIKAGERDTTLDELSADTRKTVQKAIVARREALAAEAPEESPYVEDDDEREELGGGIGSIEDGGTELTGGFGGDNEAGQLGGLGSGENEVSGDLSGESSSVVQESRRTKGGRVRKREGAGCKQPDAVDGWAPGRIMVVVKPHRGPQADWGKCEYRVKCLPSGGYELVYFSGARTDVAEGQTWDYVSPMLTDLMGIPRDGDGKPTRHHRMTLKRWFRLGADS